MKVKFSWIPFIPIALGMAGLKTLGFFLADSNGEFYGMNFIEMSYTVIGAGLALFLLCVLVNIIDRKTAPVYSAGRNVPAAVFAVMSAAMVLATSALAVLNSADDQEFFLVRIICAFFAFLASLAFIFMARVHSTGIAPISNVSFLYVFPSLWACSELVSCFFEVTKVSISATDTTPLFCYIFLSLYLFSHAMVVSKIKGRNPVKGSFIYGLPAAAFSLTAGVYFITTGITEGMRGTIILNGAMLVFLAFYAISFVAELTKNGMTKDEVEIIDEIPDDSESEDATYIETTGYNGISRTENKEETSEDSSKSVRDINDFIMGYEGDDDAPVEYVTKTEKPAIEEVENGFFTGAKIETDEEAPIIKAVSKPAYSEIEQQEKIEVSVEPKTEKQVTAKTSEDRLEERMSEIDRLIAELEAKK